MTTDNGSNFMKAFSVFIWEVSDEDSADDNDDGVVYHC